MSQQALLLSFCKMENRFFIALLALGVSSAQAETLPKPLTAAATEARNEAAAPSFSIQVRQAHRVASFLVDALVLNLVQQRAVEACTVAEYQALALAATVADATAAQQAYRQAVRRVLATSQAQAYAALSRQLTDTALPLDGTEVAAR